jgi:N6-L-threonylcarbamoyladenine synthase
MPSLLAIESSCDETSAAVIRDGAVLSNIIATQKVHAQYGGVVPELASRAHMSNIVPVVEAALKEAGVERTAIDAVAFTQSPGLIGSLMVGASFAKAYAQALNVPVIAVHHMQAHILAHFIDERRPEFPFLCLTVSGGHTQIVLCRDYLDMEVLGETQDDAAGEAFDKAAKMLGLPYPGGPLVDKYAQQGDPKRFVFSTTSMPGYGFSFSGVKTSILYFLQKEVKKNPDFIKENLADICASVQYRIISMLMEKLVLAAANTGIRHIGIAGGVSANSGLRKALQETGERLGWQIYIPAFEYCTDNAAMIGITAWHKFLRRDFADMSITPSARATWA